MLEGGAGLPDSRENAQGSVSKRGAGGAEQPGQRDTVDQSEGIAEAEAREAETEETSRRSFRRKRGRRGPEEETPRPR